MISWPILTDYGHAVLPYWWVVVVGGVMALSDLYKFHLPEGKEFKLPDWARLGISVGAVMLAQFLAYRDSIRNLSQVIEERRQLSIQINTCTDTLRQRDIELASSKQEQDDLRKKIPSESSLKSRALEAAKEWEALWRQRAKHAPTCTQTSKMTPAEQQAVIQPCVTYNGDDADVFGTLGSACHGDGRGI
jgi:hypothetical protein